MRWLLLGIETASLVLVVLLLFLGYGLNRRVVRMEKVGKVFFDDVPATLSKLNKALRNLGKN